MRLGAVAVGCLVLASVAGTAGAGPPRPHLSLRATPRVALTPGVVMLTGELEGGDDSEDFHCPAVEWDWDDGSRSTREADCAPFRAGSAIDRLFSARHVYRDAGTYTARLTLRRAGRALAVAAVTIAVRGLAAPD